MSRVLWIAFLSCITCDVAVADVWKWVDAKGTTHYVDTMTPIYTWEDEHGKVHYSDTPDHEDAVSVQLMWHSSGTIDELAVNNESDQEYYCRRATEVYESYLNAPQLYRTNEDGEREFLSEEEAKRTIADTLARKERYCNQGQAR